MAIDNDHVWVSIEVTRAGVIGGYRGRVLAADFEAITSGNYFQPFLTIEHVHWVDWVWNEQEQRFRARFTVYGRDAQWRWNAGSISVRVDTITSIALLEDCTALLEDPEAANDHGVGKKE